MAHLPSGALELLIALATPTPNLHALVSGFDKAALPEIDLQQFQARATYWRYIVQGYLKRGGNLYSQPAEDEYAYATPRSFGKSETTPANPTLPPVAPARHRYRARRCWFVATQSKAGACPLLRGATVERKPLLDAEIQAPCAEGKTHPVRVALYGWGEFEVVWNPCEERLGVFGAPAPCQNWLNKLDWFHTSSFALQRLTLVERLARLGGLMPSHTS